MTAIKMLITASGILVSLISTNTLASKITNKSFYVGENIGVHQSVFDTTGKLYASSSGEIYRPETNGGSSTAFSFFSNTYAGVSKVTKRFYYGAELNFAALAGSGKAINIKGSFNTTTGQSSTYSVKQNIRMFYGLSALIGSRINLSSNNVVFFRIGIANAKFNSSSSTSEGYQSGYSGSFSRWDQGCILGIGLNTFYTPKLAVRAEYDYIAFAKYSETSSGSDWYDGASATWHYHPHTSLFSIGILYFL